MSAVRKIAAAADERDSKVAEVREGIFFYKEGSISLDEPLGTWPTVLDRAPSCTSGKSILSDLFDEVLDPDMGKLPSEEEELGYWVKIGFGQYVYVYYLESKNTNYCSYYDYDKEEGEFTEN